MLQELLIAYPLLIDTKNKGAGVKSSAPFYNEKYSVGNRGKLSVFQRYIFSGGIYSNISDTLQFKMLHKVSNVVVVIGFPCFIR